jgi:anthranilate phosphoribosyltransferase
VLGPLTNPAGATAQVVGVYSADLTERLAAVLGALGLERALVVHGAGGMDEFSLAGPTKVSEWSKGAVQTYMVGPSDVGLTEAPLSSIQGGDAETNASLIRGLLAADDGACRDVVAFNAAAALVAVGISAGLREGVERSLDAIRSGAAASMLARWSEATNSLA